MNLKNEALVELEQINRALFKIEHTGYGICEKCHKEIGKARLDALPYTSFCSDCAA
jgi:RNA polymerase-binding transcription factor DksA